MCSAAFYLIISAVLYTLQIALQHHLKGEKTARHPITNQGTLFSTPLRGISSDSEKRGKLICNQ